MAWSPSQYRDAHAGRSETSILLALDPRRVRMDLAEAGATQPLDELMATMRTGGVKAVSANGVLGDPIGATDEEGAALLDAMAADLFARVGAFVD
jgi:creatinine amidohydrolase